MSALVPHRSGRAQFTHPVLRRTVSLTIRHSDGQPAADMKVGDRVLLDKKVGTKVNLDGEILLFVHVDDILAVYGV